MPTHWDYPFLAAVRPMSYGARWRSVRKRFCGARHSSRAWKRSALKQRQSGNRSLHKCKRICEKPKKKSNSINRNVMPQCARRLRTSVRWRHLGRRQTNSCTKSRSVPKLLASGPQNTTQFGRSCNAVLTMLRAMRQPAGILRKPSRPTASVPWPCAGQSLQPREGVLRRLKHVPTRLAGWPHADFHHGSDHVLHRHQQPLLQLGAHLHYSRCRRDLPSKVGRGTGPCFMVRLLGLLRRHLPRNRECNRAVTERPCSKGLQVSSGSASITRRKSGGTRRISDGRCAYAMSPSAAIRNALDVCRLP
mmetsp:Transcript_38495/g.76319  ORF Transcript_38495/g.76319 Transcript_38495/m.76319 type:complete len:305 (+) Transcript_38495:64-978(+)